MRDFQMVMDGRFRHGGHNPAAIKDLKCDICSESVCLSVCLSQYPPAFTQSPADQRPSLPALLTPFLPSASAHPGYSRVRPSHLGYGWEGLLYLEVRNKIA